MNADRIKEWHERNLAGESYHDIAMPLNIGRTYVGRMVREYRKAKGIEVARRYRGKAKTDYSDGGPTGPRVFIARVHSPVRRLSSFEDVLAENTCRYIEGDPKTDEAQFCGDPKAQHSSFCPGHHALCRTGETVRTAFINNLIASRFN